MSLPSAYLTSTKKLSEILDSIKNAQAPERFTTRFLEGLGYKSGSDRLIIGVLKSLNFVDENGRPTRRYHEFIDATQSKAVLAEAIEDAYEDLFRVNRNAHSLGYNEIYNKMKTLSEGQYSESVLKKMAMTFSALCKNADFDAPRSKNRNNAANSEMADEHDSQGTQKPSSNEAGVGIKFGGLNYNIHIHLPESRDPAVYDALFKSLKEHFS